MRVLKWTGVGLGALVVLLSAGLLLVDWNALRSPAERAATALLGRPVTIGALDVDPGWTTRIDIRQLRIGNESWASADHLAEIDRLDVDLRVWPLLVGDLVLPRVALAGGQVALERDAEGRRNWDIGGVAPDADDLTRSDPLDGVPVPADISIEDLQLTYRDRKLGVDMQGTVATATASGEEGRQFEMALAGNLGGDRVELRLAGDIPDRSGSGDTAYRARLDAAAAGSRLFAEGTLENPLTLDGVRADIRLTGPDLARLLPALELPLPATPPYDLSGHLVRDGDRWRVTALVGKIGDSDIRGELTVAAGDDKPAITGALVSDRLRFVDLAPLIGLPTPGMPAASAPGAQAQGTNPGVDRTVKVRSGDGEAGEGEPGGFFPDTRLDREPFHTANVDLSFTAHRVEAPPVYPVTAIASQVTLRDGMLRLEEFEAAVADGSIAGNIAIDARPEVPVVGVALRLDRLDLRHFFRATQFIQEMEGRFGGTVRLTGTGFSLDELFAGADGQAGLVMEGGSMSGLIVEGVGLDLAEALVMVVGGDARVALRCGRVDMEAQGGRLRIERALLDTSDSLLVGGGTADLAAETLALQLEARAKDFSLIDMAAPVAVTGPMRAPSIGIGGFDPLPFLELGDQEDLDCVALLAPAAGTDSGRRSN